MYGCIIRTQFFLERGLCRANDIISFTHDMLSRTHDIISRVRDVLSRTHDIISIWMQSIYMYSAVFERRLSTYNKNHISINNLWKWQGWFLLIISENDNMHECSIWQDRSMGTKLFYSVTLNFEFDLFLKTLTLQEFSSFTGVFFW